MFAWRWKGDFAVLLGLTLAGVRILSTVDVVLPGSSAEVIVPFAAREKVVDLRTANLSVATNDVVTCPAVEFVSTVDLVIARSPIDDHQVMVACGNEIVAILAEDLLAA